ncbi:MAG: helix-turn-helix domain-containing protein [Bacteroidota bacterium]
MKTENQFIAEKIVHHRKLKGVTQEDLAEACNLNVRTIQRIEAAEVDPRLYTLKTIAEALDVSMESFIPPPEEKDRGSLVALHLSSLAYFIFPFGGNVIDPLIFWVYKKDRVNHVDRQGRDLLNAQISYSLYQILLFVAFTMLLLAPAISGSPDRVDQLQGVGLSISFAFFFAFIPLGTLLILAIILPIIKAVRIYRAKEVKPYPLKIRFIR